MESLTIFPGAERALLATRPVRPDWIASINQFRGLCRRDLIREINIWINKIPYVDDMSNYGVPDFWQTPDEFFAKGGDCEDYAVAKYTALRELHVPASDMFIVVGRFVTRNISHALLSVRDEDKIYYLCNENDQPLEVVEDFFAFYRLNETGAEILHTPKLRKDT